MKNDRPVGARIKRTIVASPAFAVCELPVAGRSGCARLGNVAPDAPVDILRDAGRAEARLVLETDRAVRLAYMLGRERFLFDLFAGFDLLIRRYAALRARCERCRRRCWHAALCRPRQLNDRHIVQAARSFNHVCGLRATLQRPLLRNVIRGWRHGEGMCSCACRGKPRRCVPNAGGFFRSGRGVGMYDTAVAALVSGA